MRRMAMICLALSVIPVTASARHWEIQGAVEMFFPNSNLWDSKALGGEVKAVYWWDADQVDTVGIALSTGFLQWNVANQIIEDTREAGTGRTQGLEGNVQYVPLGLSLLSRVRVPNCPQTRANFEFGLHYMFCSSGLEGIQTQYLDGAFLGEDRLEMGCDDGLVGRVGIGLEWALSRNQSTLFASAGYQFDLDKGKAVEDSWMNISKDLELAAYFLQIGLAIPIP